MGVPVAQSLLSHRSYFLKHPNSEGIWRSLCVTQHFISSSSLKHLTTALRCFFCWSIFISRSKVIHGTAQVIISSLSRQIKNRLCLIPKWTRDGATYLKNQILRCCLAMIWFKYTSERRWKVRVQRLRRSSKLAMLKQTTVIIFYAGKWSELYFVILAASKCTAELTSRVCCPPQWQKGDENATEQMSHAVSNGKRVKDADRTPGFTSDRLSNKRVGVGGSTFKILDGPSPSPNRLSLGTGLNFWTPYSSSLSWGAVSL